MSFKASTIGRTIVSVVAVLLIVDGILQLASPPPMVEALIHVGYPADAGPRLAAVTLSCAILLIVPRTSVIGAILTTAFLGGAISAHFRLGDVGTQAQVIGLLLGLATWGGLALADPRARLIFSLSVPQPREKNVTDGARRPISPVR